MRGLKFREEFGFNKSFDRSVINVSFLFIGIGLSDFYFIVYIYILLIFKKVLRWFIVIDMYKIRNR